MKLKGVRWPPPLYPSLVLVGIVAILLLWKLPELQVARSTALTNENRFARENEARKTLAQILAGVAVLAGLCSSMKSFNLSRDGQITDRFTKAIEQLGALDEEGVRRLGGIYALERIARDSERDHWVIMEVLTAYIRERSPLKKEDKPKPPIGADIQAILTVLRRRELKYDKDNRLNLGLSCLAEAVLGRANFFEANLVGADLRGSHLDEADLRLADLSWADLSGAHLSGARLSRTRLHAADLSAALGLTQKQIDSALGNKQTKLPSDFRRPESWLQEQEF